MCTVTDLDKARKLKRLVNLQGRLYDGDINFLEYMEEYNRHFKDDDLGGHYDPFEHDGVELTDD